MQRVKTIDIKGELPAASSNLIGQQNCGLNREMFPSLQLLIHLFNYKETCDESKQLKAHQLNKLRIKRKKNSFATHGRLSVWDRTGLALVQKSRSDPERTAGLLISAQQQECGVCTLK